MIDYIVAGLIGFLIGLVCRFGDKDKDIKEQVDIYNRTYQKYEEQIKYYKELCKWHVEQKEKK
jgi:hypothetical protein